MTPLDADRWDGQADGYDDAAREASRMSCLPASRMRRISSPSSGSRARSSDRATMAPSSPKRARSTLRSPPQDRLDDRPDPPSRAVSLPPSGSPPPAPPYVLVNGAGAAAGARSPGTGGELGAARAAIRWTVVKLDAAGRAARADPDRRLRARDRGGKANDRKCELDAPRLLAPHRRDERGRPVRPLRAGRRVLRAARQPLTLAAEPTRGQARKPPSVLLRSSSIANRCGEAPRVGTDHVRDLALRRRR